MGFFNILSLHFSYILGLFHTTNHSPKVWNQNQNILQPKPKPKHTTNQNQNILHWKSETKTKRSKTYYKVTNYWKSETSKCKQNRYYKPSTHGTKSLSQSKWKQILQAFNTWHKILEPKQMEANITSLQLIIDGTQNPTKHSLCTKSSSIVVLYFFIYLSYLTNINN
jgi:superfamily II DNA helicase RecQ